MHVDLFVLISFSSFWSSVVSQIFLLCFFSDMLGESVRYSSVALAGEASEAPREPFYFQSSSLAESIQNSSFYALDRKVQKDLLFIIMRSRKPKLIVAGGFFKLDIAFSTDVSINY